MRAKNLVVATFLLALLLPVVAAFGRICSVDKAPGATLLLPYFEVDLDRPQGRTTLFSIANASAASILTNVTVWSDLGVPVLWFHVYLTGLDVQTINVRDILNGVLPRTASHGQDPDDTISPKGQLSQDISFASCNGFLPLPTVPPAFVDHLRKALTGRRSEIFAACAGQNLGDNVARGYVTVDTIRRCELKNPSDPGYFGPEGMATNQNVLWGDFILVDEEQNFAQGEDLVRLEADPARFPNGSSTFYGRYVGYSGADAREPLPSLWGARYLVGGAFSGGTDFLVWRESGGILRAFPCGQTPPGFPLLTLEQAYFDEEENVVVPWQFIFDPPQPQEAFQRQFPAESNRIDAAQDYGLAFPFGWLYIDVGPSLGAPPGRTLQGWMGTLVSAENRYSVGMNATPLFESCPPVFSGSR
jgi:hypothetical protein